MADRDVTRYYLGHKTKMADRDVTRYYRGHKTKMADRDVTRYYLGPRWRTVTIQDLYYFLPCPSLPCPALPFTALPCLLGNKPRETFNDVCSA